MKTRYFALLCALLVFSQFLQADCESQERKKERANPGKGGRAQPGSDNQNRRGQKKQGENGSLKGKFTTKDKSECSWTLNEAQTATLKVDCKREENTFSCEFVGNPSTCPQYGKNQKAFWKQITRSLKKQKNICKDPKSTLKSKLCKAGPPAAHLRLVALTSQDAKQEKPIHHGRETALSPVPPVASETQPGRGSSDCVEDADYVDQEKVAEQNCPVAWSSFCKFLVSMVQDKKCK